MTELLDGYWIAVGEYENPNPHPLRLEAGPFVSFDEAADYMEMDGSFDDIPAVIIEVIG